MVCQCPTLIAEVHYLSTWFVPSAILVQHHRLHSGERLGGLCQLVSWALPHCKESAKADSTCPHHYLFYKLIWLFNEMWFGMWFSWFRQKLNAKTCWDGPDKMPTKNLGRTKCPHRKKSGNNANLWLALCPVGILSYHPPKYFSENSSDLAQPSFPM